MATKDISDLQVVLAYLEAKEQRDALPDKPIYGMAPMTAAEKTEWPYDILERRTGQPHKVCYRAMERGYHRGLVEYGVSLRSGWVTDKGKELVREACAKQGIPVPPELDAPRKPVDMQAAMDRFAAALMPAVTPRAKANWPGTSA